LELLNLLVQGADLLSQILRLLIDHKGGSGAHASGESSLRLVALGDPRLPLLQVGLVPTGLREDIRLKRSHPKDTRTSIRKHILKVVGGSFIEGLLVVVEGFLHSALIGLLPPTRDVLFILIYFLNVVPLEDIALSSAPRVGIPLVLGNPILPRSPFFPVRVYVLLGQ